MEVKHQTKQTNYQQIFVCVSNEMNLSSIHREELARQTELTEKYFTKMKDLKIMLESSRSRVKVGIEGLHYITNEITCMPAKVKISLVIHPVY